ncbi:MAG: hypothetical protein M1825_001197 [Sarcosagium campestre]|nr:MAG: hypothetical protein M1825_001197 [Sarcosagium campestre]
MASAVDPEEDVFDRLNKTTDPKKQHQHDEQIQKRLLAQQEKAQQRLAELLDSNSTLPVTLSSISVVGAPHTRKGFLQRIFRPLLSEHRDAPYTLAGALQQINSSANTLHKFDIFHVPISLYIDRPDKAESSSTPSDLAVYLTVREKSRFLLKTGTDVGNAEGSAYGNLTWRNIFGGAETFNVNASLGTRTRSAYSVGFDTPVLSNPDLRWEFGGLASATQRPWASHEEVQKGLGSKLRWLTSSGTRHEFGFSGIWRQITGLAPNASPTVRGDAGDSVKNSVSHVWTTDRRDNPLLPSTGYMLKSTSELAGWGPLQGDVAFWKSELESQAAVPIPLPFLKGPSGISLMTGLRAGLLYPLALGTRNSARSSSSSSPEASCINDRFQLGGPTDVRGFRLSGLGPRDGQDAVGGDVYAAGSANLLLPLPRVGVERPLRLQAFVNGGRLLALRDYSSSSSSSSSSSGGRSGEEEKGGAAASSSSSSSSVQQNVVSTIAELANGLPSLAAGVGIVYAHPVARFELNFSLPIVLRKGEQGRKGLQFGVGISFL